MLRRAGTHFRSNVIGYVALFFALSAGAYAAGLDNNSVKSETIKDGEVASADLKNNGVKGKDVAESTLKQVDAGTLDGFDSADFDVEAGYAQRVDFSENDPLSLVVPDYGTFQLLCDDNDTAGDPNDDVVQYGYSTTLGADAQTTILQAETDGAAVDPTIRLRGPEANDAFGVLGGSGDRLLVNQTLSSADGASQIKIEASGFDIVTSTVDCKGSIRATIQD